MIFIEVFFNLMALFENYSFNIFCFDFRIYLDCIDWFFISILIFIDSFYYLVFVLN